jgi:eukaryotic-like serine/threonine-protein kinase
MNDLSRRARVDALFDAALEQSASERAAWLERACGGEPSLRAEVARLLSFAERDDEALRPLGAQEGPLWEEVAAELQKPPSPETLAPGDHVGPYVIVGLLGQGGAGTVYSAWDPRLERSIAVKALSHAFADDLSNLWRFEREAKVLASLGHPNVASIYELLWSDGRPFLVLELVEGETLGQRIARGPLKLRETLNIAIQLTEALEEAHRRGVMHRDLKPSNVMVSASGRVKVLDFGIAKSVQRRQRDPANDATDAALLTREGVVVGTPAYMSPEQARGEEVDQRTDIWALGCLLYEMLAGRRAFSGASVAEAQSSVEHDEADWGRLPAETPTTLRRILKRCLQKNPHDRLQAAGDLRIELEELARGPQRSREHWRRPTVAVAALLVAAAGGWLLRPRVGPRATDPPTLRAVLNMTPDVRLWIGSSTALAIAPDGSRVAFIGDHHGRAQLYLRAMDSAQASPVLDSDDARNPFFSPDGAWVGFFARGELRKMPVTGRSSERITAAGSEPRGASWSADGRIAFGQVHSPGLLVVDAAGGTPQPLTEVDRAAGEIEHSWPHWVAGTQALLYVARRRAGAGSEDEVALLAPGQRHGSRLRPGSQPVFADSGHLLFTRGGGVEAAPFDRDSLALNGPAVSVLEAVHVYPQGAAAFALSRSGSLVYVPPLESVVLDWIDAAGKTATLSSPPGTPGWPRIAPAGGRIAIHVGRPESRDVWLLDPARPGAFRQLTSGGGGFPVWSPDGRWIAFASRSEDAPSLQIVSVDGDTPPRLVHSGKGTVVPVSWSKQGRLAFYEVSEHSQRDIFVLDVQGGGPPTPVVTTPANELAPAFSPDGTMLAYVSNQSGRNEVYVQQFPSVAGPATAVTVEGGTEPVWSRDGSRLFYRAGDSLWSVGVRLANAVTLGTPRKVLETTMVPNASGNAGYDVAPDGRFLMLRSAGAAMDAIHVVVGMDWDLRGSTPRAH